MNIQEIAREKAMADIISERDAVLLSFFAENTRLTQKVKDLEVRCQTLEDNKKGKED